MTTESASWAPRGWPHQLLVNVYPMTADDRVRVADYLHSPRCIPEPRAPACWTWSEYDWRCAEQDVPGRLDAIVNDLATLRAWHKGRCANCGDRCPLVCDHDHWTGYVRGYLCNGCNHSESLGKLTAYCWRHPARIHGLLIPHPRWTRGRVVDVRDD